MARFPSWYIILAIYFASSWAQTLDGTRMYFGSSGLSESCTTALDTEVLCPGALAILSTSNTILDDEQVEALCIDSCRTSLESTQKAIERTCTADTDRILYGGAEYPATYIVENFLLTYETSCRKDRKTGAFCDPQFLGWSAQSNLTSEQKYCSDCWLGVQALQLSSPLGYDEGLASKFASLTSSCTATGYDFTTPTVFPAPSKAGSGSSSTPTEAGTTAPPSSICREFYPVKAADDCNAVAKVHSVSTYDLLRVNNLDLYCYNFENAVGKQLCIPPTCETYSWQAQDSCENIVKQFPDISITQFLSWNPMFNRLCQNSLNFVGYEVCVRSVNHVLLPGKPQEPEILTDMGELSPPGGYLPTQSAENSSRGTSTVTPVPVPSNAVDGSTRACGKWYTVSSGDTCSIVSIANSISLSDFYSLNPQLNKDCTDLLLDLAYCVQPINALGKATNEFSRAKRRFVRS